VSEPRYISEKTLRRFLISKGFIPQCCSSCHEEVEMFSDESPCYLKLPRNRVAMVCCSMVESWSTWLAEQKGGEE
jgi:hypothetical protein